MSNQRRFFIVPIVIVLVATMATMGVATGDTNTTAAGGTTPVKYPYNGNLPPWVDPNSAINTKPAVIANATLWSSPTTNPYNGNLPPWIDYNIRVDPFYDNGPIVLTVTGNVGNKLNLTMAKLSLYNGIAVNAKYSKGWYNVTGASLNDILNDAQPGPGATSVTFYGSGNYKQTIPLSTITADHNAIVALDCPPDGSLRDILPSQAPSAKQWVSGLYSIVVS